MQRGDRVLFRWAPDLGATEATVFAPKTHEEKLPMWEGRSHRRNLLCGFRPQSKVAAYFFTATKETVTSSGLGGPDLSHLG